MEVDVNIEDKNKWSIFSEVKPLELIEYASKNGHSNFFFEISPSEANRKLDFINPIVVQNELNGYDISKNTCARFNKQKSLIVNSNVVSDALRILDIKKLFGIEVSSRLITENLTSKFLIRDIDLEFEAQQVVDFLSEGNNFTILAARRFFHNKNPTLTWLITIPGSNIPEYVKFGALSIETEIFYERPIQCKQCLKFGHFRNKCRSNPKCEKCGTILNYVDQEGKEIIHDVVNCDIVKCGNCGDNHQSVDQVCPEYYKNIEIYKLRNNLRVPSFEARRTFVRDQRKPNYSRIVEKKAVSCECASLVENLRQDCRYNFQKFQQTQEKKFEDFQAECRELIKTSSWDNKSLDNFVTKSELDSRFEAFSRHFDNWFTQKFDSVEKKVNLINEKLDRLLKVESPKLKRKKRKNLNKSSLVESSSLRQDSQEVGKCSDTISEYPVPSQVIPEIVSCVNKSSLVDTSNLRQVCQEVDKCSDAMSDCSESIQVGPDPDLRRLELEEFVRQASRESLVGLRQAISDCFHPAQT